MKFLIYEMNFMDEQIDILNLEEEKTGKCFIKRE